MSSSIKPTSRTKTPAYTVDMSADGLRYLWGGGSPGESCPVQVCDRTTNKALFTLGAHRKPVVRARFLADGSIVSCSFDSHVCRWSPDGKLLASNKQKLVHRADGCAISRDGKWVVTGDYRGQMSAWDMAKGTQKFAWAENPQGLQIWALDLDPTGGRLASGGAEGKIRLWKVASKRQELEIDLGRGQHIRGVAWAPDGKSFIAATAPDGTAEKGARSRVNLYKASGEEVAAYPTDGHQPFCCAFGHQGNLVAAAGGGSDRGGSESKANCVIHVWDARSGKSVATLSGHTGLVRDLAFSPDGRVIFSAGWDSTVRRWTLPPL